MPVVSGVDRGDYIAEQTLLFLDKIKKTQGIMARRILDDFIQTLELNGDRVATSAKNYRTIAQLDKLYAEFIKEKGIPLIDDFIRRTQGLFDLNETYFEGVSDVSERTFARAMKNTKELVYTSMGVNPKTGALLDGGPLAQIISDFAPINEIKEQLFSAVANNLLTTEMRGNVQVIATGDGITKGAFEKHFDRTMKDPFEKFDRTTGSNASIGLQLNFAQYQGGIVKNTRDFCKVRNGNVFSRDEISKFGTPQDVYGGYTNKGAGEFQGKIKVGYDPFRDLGGYNCLHLLSWISDELAYTLRPELRPPEAPRQ